MDVKAELALDISTSRFRLAETTSLMTRKFHRRTSYAPQGPGRMPAITVRMKNSTSLIDSPPWKPLVPSVSSSVRSTNFRADPHSCSEVPSIGQELSFPPLLQLPAPSTLSVNV